MMRRKPRNSVWAHVFAAPSGTAFDPELVKDYWLGSDEPWSPECEVRLRFIKLMYMYLASGLVQIGLPVLMLFFVGALFKGELGSKSQTPLYVLIFSAGITCVGIAFAMFLACLKWWQVEKMRASSGGKP